MQRSSETITTIAKAMQQFQEKVGAVSRTTMGQVGPRKYKYATLENVIATVRPILHELGMVYMQSVGMSEFGHFVETRIQHIESDEWISSRTPVLCKDQNDPQKLGSGMTYARRYDLVTICCLETEDDDGKAGSTPRKPKAEKVTPVPLNIEDLKTKAGIKFVKSYATADGTIAKLGEKYTMTSDDLETVKAIHASEA